jgi:tetratricopeptide (TPR) repeat protein
VAAATIGVAALAYGLVRVLGLPDWAFSAALALLGIGLPILVVTGYQERRRRAAAAPGIPRLFTWRRALTGGGLAFGVLAAVTGGFMAMRTLGFGPAATLVSSGRLADRARLIVADFANRTTDSTLGPSLAEAFRIDLSQSPVIRVMAPDEIGRVLTRMERPESTRVTSDVAHEVAEREGLAAIIEGEVGTVGGGYVLSARVVAPATGTELLAARETASNEAELLPALARLSTRVRKGIGESYRSLRATPPLEAVTTSSLEALRLYTRGSQAARAGEFLQAIDLLDQAVAIDTAFATGYRQLAVAMGIVFRNPVSRQIAAASAAFHHRDRLPPLERYLTEASYYTIVEYDPQRFVAAYQAVLAIDPTNATALNNLAYDYFARRQWAQAESLYMRVIAVSDTGVWQAVTNTANAEYNQGHTDEARRWLHVAQRRFPALPPGFGFEGVLLYAEGKYDSTIAFERSALTPFPVAQQPADFVVAAALTVQGRLAEADAVRARRESINAEAGDSAAALQVALDRAGAAISLADRPDSAVGLLDAARRRYGFDRIPPSDRPWSSLIMSYARAGRPAEARAMLARWEREVPARQHQGPDYDAARGAVALAEGRSAEARDDFAQAWDQSGCNNCYQDLIGQAWDAQGNADSALAAYERFLGTPEMFRVSGDDPTTRAAVLRRAGELHEQLGHPRRAAERYAELVALWKDADPSLQPIVADVKARLARLSGEGHR